MGPLRHNYTPDCEKFQAKFPDIQGKGIYFFAKNFHRTILKTPRKDAKKIGRRTLAKARRRKGRGGRREFTKLRAFFKLFYSKRDRKKDWLISHVSLRPSASFAPLRENSLVFRA